MPNLDHLLEGVIGILSESDLDRVLNLIMDNVVEASGAQRGFLVLPTRQDFEVLVARNLDREDIENPDFEVSRTLLKEALKTGESVRHDDVLSSVPLDAAPSLRRLSVRSALCVPIPIDAERRGAVYLIHEAPRRFTTEIETRISSFVGQISAGVRNALRFRDLERAEKDLRRDLRRMFAFQGIVGTSPALLTTLERSASVASVDVAVLILGESGVGKELIARSIHANSPRSDKPFVSVNCAALTEQLLESELFGHVRGAFSGADRDRAGLFEAADNGTLFLDEVGDTSSVIQAKLLRAAQSGEVRRVGSDRARMVNVRIVSATNRDLAQMIQGGQFRQDLFYRLGAITLSIPPLRERREDIPVLCTHFLKLTEANAKKQLDGFEDDALAALVSYSFPGNIRELQNIVQHAAVFAKGPRVKLSDLPPTVAPSSSKPAIAATTIPRTREELKAAKDRADDELERLFVTQALREAGGNVTRAAETTGMDRTQLQHMMSKHGLSAADFKQGG